MKAIRLPLQPPRWHSPHSAPRGALSMRALPATSSKASMPTAPPAERPARSTRETSPSHSSARWDHKPAPTRALPPAFRRALARISERQRSGYRSRAGHSGECDLANRHRIRRNSGHRQRHPGHDAAQLRVRSSPRPGNHGVQGDVGVQHSNQQRRGERGKYRAPGFRRVRCARQGVLPRVVRLQQPRLPPQQMAHRDTHLQVRLAAAHQGGRGQGHDWDAEVE